MIHYNDDSPNVAHSCTLLAGSPEEKAVEYDTTDHLVLSQANSSRVYCMAVSVRLSLCI